MTPLEFGAGCAILVSCGAGIGALGMWLLLHSKTSEAIEEAAIAMEQARADQQQASEIADRAASALFAALRNGGDAPCVR